LGEPRARKAPLTQREKDIARSTQVRFEEAAVHCLSRLHRLVPTERVAMAGGCALNGVANARILRDTPFTTPYLQAAASDDGTCLGAAYYVWHQVLGRRERFHMQHAFWGPAYPEERLRAVAEASGFPLRVCANEAELVEGAAGMIADGLVLGWYQGRSEWGPRALGNRSILANPMLPTMKDTINAKIKRRESFRPFAPSVLKECVPLYFEQTVDSPFMMHVVKIRPEWRERLPAVTHVDGTGRLQSVERANNPLYYDLIDAFRRRTGVGVVLNTSFNENEPIVDTPEQALDCFRRTDMDALCLGRYVLVKSAG
jgi:carbamoyltransferase